MANKVDVGTQTELTIYTADEMYKLVEDQKKKEKEDQEVIKIWESYMKETYLKLL